MGWNSFIKAKDKILPVSAAESTPESYLNVS